FLILQIIAILGPGSHFADAFWWPKTTTEPPNGGPMMQQIPLTYFRTYTYQPLGPGPGGAFGMPFFGFGQTPLLQGPGPQYDPYAVTSYAAARRHDQVEVSAPTTSTTTTPAPTTTSTTTTTTTTTPVPTTTRSTTTTTTTPPPAPRAPAQAAASSSSEGSSAAPGSGQGPTSSLLRYGEYPTYSRRVSNLYNARPQYPYPDYFNYQNPNVVMEQGQGQGAGSRIQFVPCMCPVSVPSLVASAPGASSPPVATSSPSSESQPAARHIESNELEAEAENDGDDDEDEDDEEADAGVQDVEEGVTKSPNLKEPQETTSDSSL
ncbi:hypothetical protein KR009_009885, partial [Drosophila setifemur]